MPGPGDQDASLVGNAHDDGGAPHDASPGIDGGDGDGDGGTDGRPVDSGQEPRPDAGEPDSGEPSDSPDGGGDPDGFTPAPGQVGAPCMNDNECDGFNASCATEVDDVTLPGGYCTRPCLATCGPNERCTENFCVRTCVSNGDCRAAEGYECRNEVCTLPGL